MRTVGFCVSAIIIYLILFRLHFTYAEITIEVTEKDCPNSPKGLTKLDYVLYYDGNTTGDQEAISQVCAVWEKFGEALTVTFKIGAFVGHALTGHVVCAFYDEDSCRVLYQHACAYKMVKDWKKFVCCHTGAGNKIEDCVRIANVDWNQFQNCYTGKDPNINPARIILDNSGEVFEKVPKIQLFPVPFFNQKYDECLFWQGQVFFLETICKMYADPKPRVCG